MESFTLHEKINLRSHFAQKQEDDGNRATVPYNEKKLQDIRESGHTVFAFKSEPWDVRVDGTTWNSKRLDGKR